MQTDGWMDGWMDGQIDTDRQIDVIKLIVAFHNFVTHA